MVSVYSTVFLLFKDSFSEMFCSWLFLCFQIELLVQCCCIILIICVHVDICLWLLISTKAGGFGSHGSGITGSCVPPDMVLGSWTWVLYKQGNIGGVSLNTSELNGQEIAPSPGHIYNLQIFQLSQWSSKNAYPFSLCFLYLFK